LSENHATAIAEYNQDLDHPGTLIPYDLTSDRIVDLIDTAVRAACGVGQESLFSPWKHIAYIEKGRPPGWDISRSLVATGADGVRVPSAQIDGVNVVLWRWNEQGATRLSAIDPFGDLNAN
jgi:RES domain-containing protein